MYDSRTTLILLITPPLMMTAAPIMKAATATKKKKMHNKVVNLLPQPFFRIRMDVIRNSALRRLLS
jgi:hypothetical protein